MIKKWFATILLTLVLIASSWSLLHPQFFQVHDYVHGARIAEMSRALSEGQFPVRWSQHFGYGYGMPLFEFYAPLPYYTGALLTYLGFELVLAVKMLWLLCSLGTLIGAYKLGSTLFGKSGGVLTAAALTLAPYRAVNLYVRGALAEGWGIMAMPWILYGLVQVIRGRKGGWVNLVLGLVVLFLSHNLTTLIFLPLSLAFGALLLVIEFSTQKSERKVLGRRILELAASYTLAIGLSAFYLFPAFIEKEYTKVSGILGGYFDYSLHFLYARQLIKPGWGYGGSGWGPDDGISFFLGWGQWVGLAGALVVAGWWGYRQLRRKDFNLISTLLDHRILMLGGLLVLFSGSVFMTLLKSKPLWDSIALLEFIQFPWRWLSGTIVFMSLLLGLSLTFIPTKIVRLLVATALTLSLILINWSYFRPESYLEDTGALYYSDSDKIESHMSQILNDYIPKQMPAILVPPLQLVLTTAETPFASEVIVDHAHEKLIKTAFVSDVTLELAMADFPGWEVEIDGQPAGKQTSENGLIQVALPKGEHLVGVYFSHTPVRLASDVASAVSLLIFLYLVISPKTRHNQTS